MSRVLLMAIDPWPGGSRDGPYQPFNYSVRKVQAAVQADPALSSVDLRLIDTSSKDVDALVDEVEAIDPDVLGASAYVWSFPTFLAVAERLKRTRPDRTIVFGGPSARVEMFDLAPYAGRQTAVDALVLGEGEDVFRAIVGARDRSRDALRSVPGTAVWTNGGWLRGPEAQLPVLDELASPFQLGLAPQGVTAHLESFRGCPFSCTFCQWGDLSKSNRVFSTEYLIRELEAFRASRASGVDLVDAALNLNSRAFRNLAEAERQVGFLKTVMFRSEVYPAHLTDDHLAFLEQIRPDCLGIGLQSYDREVLRRMERPFQEERFERVVRDIAAIAPNSVIEIIMGLPGDSPDSFRRTIERARKLPLSLRLYRCMVLPNALMTRAPAHYAIRFDPVSLLLQSCWGWSERDLATVSDELTAICEAEGGEMGPNYWTLPAPRGPAAPAAVSRPSARQPVDADTWARLSAATAGATSERWRLVDVLVGEQTADVRIEVPDGQMLLRARPATGERAYKSIEGIAYSYQTGSELVRPDLADLDRFLRSAHPILAVVVQEAKVRRVLDVVR